MMYLARRERGKIATVFPVNIICEPRVWEFYPVRGLAGDVRTPSPLCRPGFAAFARAPQLALMMLHSVFPTIYD